MKRIASPLSENTVRRVLEDDSNVVVSDSETESTGSKLSGLVDNVIAESHRPISWCCVRPKVLPKNDVNERKTSLEIVPISKISNSRGADQKYKLNCNGKAIMYRAKNLYREVYSTTVNSEEDLRNRIELAAQIVRNKLSLNVTVRAMRKRARACIRNGGRQFENNFVSFMICVSDEGSQLTCMSLLVGYLRLQDSRLPHVLSSGPFLYRLLVTLVHVSHLETSHVSLLEECAIRG
ncbi:hypothetical protein J6590_096805 [Homalodisca vitripennis]|nr:hypothetical protein J6590_096805 [Homalodisca vitripennis]